MGEPHVLPKDRCPDCAAEAASDKAGLPTETVIRAVIDVMNAEGLALYSTERGVQWFDRRHFGTLLAKALRTALSESGKGETE